MPRYFFHRTDGYVDHDNQGVELANSQAARNHAVVFAGESLRNDPEKVWVGHDFRVEVTDGDGTLLFTIVTLAIDSPATVKRLKIGPDGSISDA